MARAGAGEGGALHAISVTLADVRAAVHFWRNHRQLLRRPQLQGLTVNVPLPAAPTHLRLNSSVLTPPSAARQPRELAYRQRSPYHSPNSSRDAAAAREPPAAETTARPAPAAASRRTRSVALPPAQPRRGGEGPLVESQVYAPIAEEEEEEEENTCANSPEHPSPAVRTPASLRKRARASVCLHLPELLQLLQDGVDLLEAHVPDLPRAAIDVRAALPPSAKRHRTRGVFASLFERGLFRETELYILSFLSARDVLRGVALVCKSWLLLARDAELWQELALSHFGAAASPAAAALYAPEFTRWDEAYAQCSAVQRGALEFVSQLRREMVASGVRVLAASATASGGARIDTRYARVLVEWRPLLLGELLAADGAERAQWAALARFLSARDMRSELAPPRMWETFELLSKDASRHLLHCLCPRECSYALAEVQACEDVNLLGPDACETLSRRFLALFGGHKHSRFFRNGEWDPSGRTFVPLLRADRAFRHEVDSGVLVLGPRGIGMLWFAWARVCRG